MDAFIAFVGMILLALVLALVGTFFAELFLDWSDVKAVAELDFWQVFWIGAAVSIFAGSGAAASSN